MTIRLISIRKKISYGFSLALALMVGAALVMYAIMNQVEHKVVIVEVIDDFLNLTLELRRFEKNYLLYRQEKDFQDTLSYWENLHDLLDRSEPELRHFVSKDRIERTRKIMGEYHDAMMQLGELLPQVLGGEKPTAIVEALQRKIRTSGKDLTEFAENTALAERASIKNLLHRTRSILVYSEAMLVFLLLALAITLGRRILASLLLLEGYAKKISQGEMLDPPTGRMEEEIRSLLLAFHRMNNELQLRQKQLVQSEKLAALGTLLAGVAHELNNPLSNISTSAQILAEELGEGGADPNFQKELVSQIEEQTDKSRDIVKTLLEFSRTKEFHTETIPLHKLMQDTLRLIRSQTPSGVEIGIEIPEDLTIFADKQRVQQVFLNLIKNGIDAVGENGRIWISARNVHTENGEDMVEIIVEDNGPGIESQVIKKIFDPFFTTKDVGKGSGLGLFVVHDIIESHGGNIMVESRPGQGTAFIIWLKSADEHK